MLSFNYFILHLLERTDFYMNLPNFEFKNLQKTDIFIQ